MAIEITEDDIRIRLRDDNVAAHYLDVCEHLHDYEAEQLKEKILKDQSVTKRLKNINLDGHIKFLEHYLKALPVMYDKAKLETILYDWKELQKILVVDKK